MAQRCALARDPAGESVVVEGGTADFTLLSVT
jgi:hypothetical protein